MPHRDPVAAREYAREWRRRNRERYNAKHREYRAANWEAVREYEIKYAPKRPKPTTEESHP